MTPIILGEQFVPGPGFEGGGAEEGAARARDRARLAPLRLHKSTPPRKSTRLRVENERERERYIDRER